jgi:UDP-2,3-diacylglucosamine hydrolase
VSSTRIAFIGDVHLDAGDPDVAPFIETLVRLAESCDTLVLMGDLFNLWIGHPRLQQEHQRRVADTFRAVRKNGVALHYVEGNRDFRIARMYAGDLFDTAVDEGLGLRVAGRSIWAIHGDLANRADRPYRTWRRLSRSAVFWSCFNVIPAELRLAAANRLEGWMRSTNLQQKRSFPREMIDDYAGFFAARGHDAIVLGHFHVEKQWTLEGGAGVYVLPLWKRGRRVLIADGDGVRFEES